MSLGRNIPGRKDLSQESLVLYTINLATSMFQIWNLGTPSDSDAALPIGPLHPASDVLTPEDLPDVSRTGRVVFGVTLVLKIDTAVSTRPQA